MTALIRQPARSAFSHANSYAMGSLGAKLRNAVSVTDAPFNARGDGVTDDTAAIQAALDTGKDVFVPGAASHYRITAALLIAVNGQRLYGEGNRSQIRQVAANANVIAANGRVGVGVENLHLYAPGTFTSYTNGAGVHLTGCSRSRVVGVTVENHRGGGVVLYNTNDSEVEGCRFINSPVSDADGHTQAFADIAVVYSSARNTVRGNVCSSGQGTGVQLQAVANGDACDDNIVVGNIIKDCRAYGVIAYKVSAASTVDRPVIAGNVINNIRGVTLNESTANYSFGAGIYLQSAEGAAVSGNTLRATHSGAVAFAETLAPGAIGATNCSRYSITGNTILDAGMFGIDAGDPNTSGDAIGHAVISGNSITDCVRAGINVRNRGRISIAANTIDTTGNSAIRINNTVSQRPGVSIVGNQVRNVTGVAGIEVSFAAGINVAGNTVDTANTHGITLTNTSAAQVNGNVVKAHATRGIVVSATATDTSVSGNSIVGTGASVEGIRMDAACAYSANRIVGCTSAYTGTAAPWRTLTANSATPNVADGRHLTTNNTAATTITNFAGAVDGQEIEVVFLDANTTLDFSASNLKGNGGVDRAMQVGDAIRAVYRAAASAWYVTIIDA